MDQSPKNDIHIPFVDAKCKIHKFFANTDATCHKVALSI